MNYPDQVILDRPRGQTKGCRIDSQSTFNALLFLFTHILNTDMRVEGVVRAKQRRYIPVVLSRDEIDSVLEHLPYPYDLVVRLLYGCGLRLFDAMILTVHDGKGQKDRTVPTPDSVLDELKNPH